MTSLKLKAMLVFTLVFAASACKPKNQETGLRVSVKNAQGAAVLSRVAVLQAKPGESFPTAVTEAWVQPATTGTLIRMAPGTYTVRAQGTGDSFLQSEATVSKGKVTDVKLGFSTLVLDGAPVKSQGRVRVWQKLDGGREQIVVTRLVRPGEQAPIELAAGKYRVGFLPEGPTDEDKNFKPFGGDIELAAGQSSTVQVQP